jgi:hypothetical protein
MACVYIYPTLVAAALCRVVAALCIVEVILVVEKKTNNMTFAYKKRYVRWEGYRIAQFSFAINLFLTFSVGALGFCLALIKDNDFSPPDGMGYLLLHSVFSLGGSIIIGGLATFVRLWDFRCTAIKIRKKYADCRQSAAEFLAKWLGCVSWSLFYLQMATLAYGAFCLIYVLMLKNWDKFAK